MLVLRVSSVRGPRAVPGVWLDADCFTQAPRAQALPSSSACGRASILSRTFFPARSSIQHRPGAQAVLPDRGASSPACVPHHLLFPNPGVGQSGNKPSVSTSEKWAQRQQRRPREAVGGGGSAMREAPGQHLPLPHPPSLPPSLPCSALAASA